MLPLLDVIDTITNNLPHIDKVLENPAWLMFGLTIALGSMGLAALFLLYPFSRD